MDAGLGAERRSSERALHRADHPVPVARSGVGEPARASRSRRSSSAGGARTRCRSSTRRSTGRTASTSARRWAPRRPRPQPARSARSAATRWRCCRSAATTWPSYWNHWLQFGREIPDPPQDLRRQLVPAQRGRRLRLAGLRRQHAHPALDRGAGERPRLRHREPARLDAALRGPRLARPRGLLRASASGN